MPDRLRAMLGTLRPWLAFAGALLVAGCASQPLGYPIRAAGDKVINRDEGGNALSVVVRLYQLKDRKTFSKLTLEELSSGKSDEELLGSDLVSRSEVVVMPGQRATHAAQLLPDARFVGVVAMFRQPDLDHWRYLVPADRIRSNSSGLTTALRNLFAESDKATSGLLFTVRDCSIVILAPEPELLPGQRPQTSTSCPSVLADEAGATAAPASTTASGRPKVATKALRRPKGTSTIAGND